MPPHYIKFRLFRRFRFVPFSFPFTNSTAATSFSVSFAPHGELRASKATSNYSHISAAINTTIRNLLAVFKSLVRLPDEWSAMVGILLWLMLQFLRFVGYFGCGMPNLVRSRYRLIIPRNISQSANCASRRRGKSFDNWMLCRAVGVKNCAR